MEQDLRTYEWRCPICLKHQSGLTTENWATMEGKLKNVVVNHVRNTRGGGHGRDGELPSSFDSEAVDDYVEFGGESEEPHLEL